MAWNSPGHQFSPKSMVLAVANQMSIVVFSSAGAINFTLGCLLFKKLMNLQSFFHIALLLYKSLR